MAAMLVGTSKTMRCLHSRAVTWKWFSNYSSGVRYQNCHFEVEGDKMYNVVIQNVKSKGTGIFQIRQKIWSQSLTTKKTFLNIWNYRIPIFKCYWFTPLICKTALNKIYVLSAHLYNFFGGLLKTEFPITKLSFRWLTAPYWHEINIRKGNGWPHWNIWRCE